VFEAHPELAFATRAGGAGLPAKKTREGAAAREALLRALPGFAPFDDPGAIRAVLGTARTAIDDVLDALVLVDVARSIRAGTAGCVPGPDQACVDARGLRMEICF
jgi:predicted RNase H-like nuclease